MFIGDVHGCAAELETLLDRIGVTAADRVYFVGDLVSRGPEGSRVLAVLRQLGASSVMGNHERRLLDARALPRHRGPDELKPLVDELAPSDWQWMERLPLWLDVPEHGVRVVHAGVMPGVPIEDQPPRLLMNLRSINTDGSPSERWGSILWGARYTGPPHVVFGHNAREGVQLHPWATGLDSGCVYGGALTAMVLDAVEPVPPAAERQRVLVSVPARRVYFLPQKPKATP